MVAARNTAMTFNRIVDAKFDQKNPRTQNREIPSGKLSLKFSTAFCTINAVLFIVISAFFNELILILSPIALIIITGYSLTKRFTSFTQIFLGLALGIAPIAAWIAATGKLNWFPALLGIAVLFWVAGFDIIYSTLDHDYDKSKGLKNLVVKLGIKNSLYLSRFFHLLSISFFISAGLFWGLGIFYYIGCGIMSLLIAYEHSLIKADDLSKVNMAFFAMNGYVAVTYFVFVCLGIYWG